MSVAYEYEIIESRVIVSVQPVHAITVSRVTGYVSHGVPSVCILLFSLPSFYVTDGRATKSLCNR